MDQCGFWPAGSHLRPVGSDGTATCVMRRTIPSTRVHHTAQAISTTRPTLHLGSTVVTDILYLKGPWQRREEILEFPKSTGMQAVRPYVTIVRCDERRVTQLNDAARPFASSNIEMISDGLRRLRSSSGPSRTSSGASVNITIDIVETGERRQLGYHVAHHVITTTKTDAGPEANARSGVLIQDAWYIDIPPAGCIDWGDHPPMLSSSFVRAGSVTDRVHVDRRREDSTRSCDRGNNARGIGRTASNRACEAGGIFRGNP
jgi:hypothetical protein